jgi:hypothetical protein
VTGGGTINSSNSYTGVTTISGTTGWYGTDQLFVNNANALGAASGGLTISGGSVNLQGNTITRSGNVTISGGTVANGTLSKSGGNIDLQGGVVNASLAGTAGLIKSNANGASLNAAVEPWVMPVVTSPFPAPGVLRRKSFSICATSKPAPAPSR